MQPRNEIKLGINSNLQDVYLIGMLVEALCSLSSFSDDTLFWIKLCVVEAVNNSIIHAYQNESGHEVEIFFRLYADYLELHICDTGTPMSISLFESKLALSEYEDESEAPSAAGIPIIKEVMDSVEYSSESGVNRMIMVKKIQ